MNIEGIHVGIVVQNNDPRKAGRVKVFVPNVSNTQYEGWNQSTLDILFSNINENVVNILGDLRIDLPWADCASGIFGGGTSTLYGGGTHVSPERLSEEYVTNMPSDNNDDVRYAPSPFNGTCGGSFSIPNVGSHVYLFYPDGDLSTPVYFAMAHSEAELINIFKESYPTDYENNSEPAEGFRSSHVLNSNKHTIVLDDSEGVEEILVQHSSGSNTRMTNDSSIEFASNDKHILVNGALLSTCGDTTRIEVKDSPTSVEIKDKSIILKVDDDNYISMTPEGIKLVGVKIDLN